MPDQFKENKSNDPTLGEMFDTYRFADCNENVINLLMRVMAVSVQTVNKKIQIFDIILIAFDEYRIRPKSQFNHEY